MRKIFVAAMLLLASAVGYAQPRTNKIQVFDQSPQKSGKSRSSITDERNRFLIKINPGLFLNGEFPVYFEQRLWKALAFEGGAGFTRRDYLGPQGEIVPTLSGEDVADIEERNENSTIGTGFVLKSAFRLYLEGADEFPEGMYISAEARYKTNVFNYTEPQNGGSNPGSVTRLYDRFTDVVGIMGRQYELADNLLFDSYSGFGMRFKKMDVMDGVIDPNNGWVFTKKVISSAAPIFSVGFKLGYYF